MGRAGTFSEIDAQFLADSDAEDRTFIQMHLGVDALIKHRESRLGIFINTRHIRSQSRGSYKLIPCKAKLINKQFAYGGSLEIACFVACGHWYKLGDLEGDTINLLDHLDKLLPKKQKCVGLFTFQNGIQNSEGDFEKMGQSIIAKLLPERPLCIGFYNPTGHIITEDLKRLQNSWELNSHSVLFIRQMLTTFADVLPSINPNLLFAHIAHSEAGLIASSVVSVHQYGLTPKQKAFIKNQLITLTYGAVAPVPNEVLKAFNTYSKDDIAMYFARKYLDKMPKPDFLSFEEVLLKMYAQHVHSRMPNPKSQTVEDIFAQLKSRQDEKYKGLFITIYPYDSTKNGTTVTIVESKVPKNKQSFIKGDHDFQGATYQFALEENIKEFRRGINLFGGIYNGK